ncbi:MAG: protein kinase [Pyrinomonadaceae bacterium]
MKVCSVCRRCYDDSAVSCGEECYAPLSETHNGSPEMIAGYHLDFLLESGVKGRLFRARQIECGQSCFIKILSADEVNSRRFLDEAKIAAAFFHPNLADVYEVGSLKSGEVFVVAEEPDGQTLREVLDSDGAPPLLTSIEIARQAAEALHTIHLKGLIHRALNPENIILTTDHENELLVRIRNFDFGGVVERSIISNKFLIDSALDSIRYFAPEQCSGDSSSVQTDIYSLGIVLYEMLAGSPPFDAVKAAGLIEKHRNQQPPEVKIANFDLRMLLTHTLTESLQKKPQMRQPSANTFARQIRHMEQLATHVSTPPPAGAALSAPVISTQRANVAAASAVPYVSQTVSETALPAVEIENTIETALPSAVEIQERIETPEASVVETFDSSAVFKDESELASLIEPESSAELPPEFENPPLAEPQAADFAPEAPKIAEERHWLRRQVSRLKLHRKRLQTKTDQGTFEPPVAETQAPLVEAFAETVPVQVAAIGARKPTPIEWNQPKDDIPSVADVMEVLSKKQIVPTPLIQMESQELAADASRYEPAVETEPEQVANICFRKPTFIELDQSEDDVPSVADALEALSKEKLAQDHFVQTELRALPVVQAQAEPAIIEWGRLLENIASKNESRDVLPRQRLPQIRTAQADTEEITLVRPPVSRFTVELEGSEAAQGSLHARRFSYRKPTDTEFTPTLLENPRRKKTFDSDAKDVMFSAYYGKPVARFSAGRVVLSGVVGLTAVAGAFLFGGDLVTKYMQASGPGSPEAAITKPSPIDTKKTVSPSRKKGDRNAKKGRPDNGLNNADPGRVSSEEKSGQTLNSSASPESRKKERQIKSGKPSTSKEPTRPRIVKTPKR